MEQHNTTENKWNITEKHKVAVAISRKHDKMISFSTVDKLFRLYSLE